VLVEDVEVQRGQDRIAQDVLLIQEARVRVPGSTSVQIPHSSITMPIFFRVMLSIAAPCFAIRSS
jgi:hypothetical protein